MDAWTTIALDRRAGGVRVLTLNDPARHNAISLAMRDELLECAAEIAADPGARALVITGAGRSFSSGGDLREVFGDPSRSVSQMRDSVLAVYECFHAVRQLALPTIAAIKGNAIGAGLNLALCCDLRLADETARIGVSFTKIGLHPGGGCSYFLTSALGPQRALSILLEGTTLDAEEAARLGLILSIHDDVLGDAIAMAGRFAALPASLSRDIKTSVRLSEQGLEASMAHETWAQAFTATQPEIWKVLNR